MPTNTTNYDFYLPLVNNATDQDLWGGYLNTNWMNIDSFLFTATNDVTRSITGTDTATSADRNKVLLCDATSAAFNETLPDPSVVGSGFTITIKKIDATAHAVTVLPNASEKIDGVSSYILNSQYMVIRLTTNGTDWFSVASLGISANSPAFTGTPTAPTASPGTNNTQIATTAYADAAVAATPFSEEYISTGNTITAAGSLTLPHGLTGKPKFISVSIVCTSSEGNYSMGDEYFWVAGSQVNASGGAMEGISFTPDATNLNGRFGNGQWFINNKTTGAAFGINNAHWTLTVRAWK